MNIEKAKFYFGLAVLTGCIFLGVFAQRNIDQRVAAMTTDNRIVNVNASGNRIANVNVNVNVNVNASGIDPVDDLDIHIVDDRTIELTPLEFAIWLTESSGREGPIMGDNGKSRGPLQISRAAWNGFRMSSTIPYWKTISNALPTQQARR